MSLCDPDILTSYVDGALADREAWRLAAHLETCAPCADTVRAHRAIKERMRSSGALIAVPAGLADRVGHALDAAPSGPGGADPGSTSGTGAGSAGLARFGLPLGVVTLITAGGLWFARPMLQPKPVDVRALMWHHRDALNPPPGATLLTADATTGQGWVRDRLGEGSEAPALGARLRGVGICRVDGVPSAIWMYDAGRPVSLIEVYREERLPGWFPAPAPSSPGGCPKGMVAGTYGGYNAVIWKSDGRTYALVSELPIERLTRLLERSP